MQFNNASNIFISFLLAVKTMQLNVLLIVRHCRRQGGREVLKPQYISILFIICIYSINDLSYGRLLIYLYNDITAKLIKIDYKRYSN